MKCEASMINRAAGWKDAAGFSPQVQEGFRTCCFLSFAFINVSKLPVLRLGPKTAQLHRNGNESSISSSWSVPAKISIFKCDACSVQPR